MAGTVTVETLIREDRSGAMVRRHFEILDQVWWETLADNQRITTDWKKPITEPISMSTGRYE